jgi:predicted PurR-regulated permease PerM
VPSKLAVGLIAGGILVFGSLLVLLVVLSVNSFLVDLPKDQERLSALTASAIDWLNAHGVNVSGEALRQHFDLGKVMEFVGSILAKLGGVIGSGFLVLITIVFILLEVSGFPRKLRATFTNPEKSLAGLREFGDAARRYLFIKTLMGVACGVTIGIWLWILGVKYAFLLGFIVFLLNFVPYIGSYIAAIPAVLLALAEQGLGPAALVLLGYLTVNVVLGNFVEPRLMGAQLGLSALVVFTSLLIWGWVLGPAGMILAVPLTILLRIALESKDDTRWIAYLLGPEPRERNR